MSNVIARATAYALPVEDGLNKLIDDKLERQEGYRIATLGAADEPLRTAIRDAIVSAFTIGFAAGEADAKAHPHTRKKK